MKSNASPRLSAVRILSSVFKGELYDVEDAVSMSSDDKRDRDLCRRLVFGAVEKNEELTDRLNLVSKTPVSKMRPMLAANLKAALYQLLYLDAVPDFAAVNEAVTITKKTVSPSLAGFTNAVLRAALNSAVDYKPSSLSAEYSLPEWFINSLAADYGKENALKICEGFSRKTADIIRVNTLKTDLSSLSSVYGSRLSPLTDTAAVFTFDGSVSEDERFKNGLFHFQNLSSQMCVETLSPSAGETILDCCASPGGKSFTAAEIMNNVGHIDCLDVSEEKVAKIKDGAGRLGIDIIETRVGDAKTYDCEKRYDRIICDVPCSGFGLLRKRPYIKLKSEASLSELPDLQFAIAKNCLRLLKTCGTLVYSTCTLREAENGAVVKKLIETGEAECVSSGVTAGVIDKENMITVIPDGIREGFFFAKLIKTGK